MIIIFIYEKLLDWLIYFLRHDGLGYQIAIGVNMTSYVQ